MRTEDGLPHSSTRGLQRWAEISFEATLLGDVDTTRTAATTPHHTIPGRHVHTAPGLPTPHQAYFAHTTSGMRKEKLVSRSGVSVSSGGRATHKMLELFSALLRQHMREQGSPLSP